jgi:serine protease Do
MVALAAAGVLAAGSAGAWSLSQWLHQPVQAGSNVVTAPPAPIATLLGGAPNYRAIVERSGPAVVGITVDGMRRPDEETETAELPDDPFLQFFRGLPGFALRGPRTKVPFHGQGSGFIVDRDGIVLTNAHVVRDASEVTVRLHDRREFRAKVLGVDPATDVAVLQIDAPHLPMVATGDPKQLKVGDYVLSIGAPYGFEQSATQGIVSATGRSLPGESYVPFIQTDAAVNPGNSGGPLFDTTGRVVGINAQIYSRSGGFEGLAFAIPIDVALHVKDQVLRQGRVEHAQLGVTLQDLTQPLAESFGLKQPDGALVANVTPGGPAAQAQLRSGDVITQVDGEAVRTPGDLAGRLGMAAPGESLRLLVWRDHVARTVDIKLAAAPAPKGEETALDASSGVLGLAVRPLTSAERRLAEADHGLLVEDAQGAALRAGIQPGDIVLAVNGHDLDNVQQLRKALAGGPKRLALLIQRQDERLFVPVRLG